MRGQPRRVAQVLGVADALRREMEALDARPEPDSPLPLDEASARQALGEEEFTQAWFEGARLSRDEAVALLRAALAAG
jgi:hypothetical protein